MASLLLAGCAALPANDEVPMAYRGYWVPEAQRCDTPLGLIVERDRLVLQNATETRSFQDIDVCHSCVGGSKSEGIEIWLIPEFGRVRPAPFIVRLNADKVLGVTRLRFHEDGLKRRFPLDEVPLRRCMEEVRGEVNPQ